MGDHSMSETAFPSLWTPEICQKSRQELLSSIWLVQSPTIWAKKPLAPIVLGSFTGKKKKKKGRLSTVKKMFIMNAAVCSSNNILSLWYIVVF